MFRKFDQPQRVLMAGAGELFRIHANVGGDSAFVGAHEVDGAGNLFPSRVAEFAGGFAAGGEWKVEKYDGVFHGWNLEKFVGGGG